MTKRPRRFGFAHLGGIGLAFFSTQVGLRELFVHLGAMRGGVKKAFTRQDLIDVAADLSSTVDAMGS